MGKELMTTKDQLNAIQMWQNEDTLHPMTCPSNSEHIMQGEIKAGKVVLVCPICGATQYQVPKIVFKRYKTWFNR